MVAMHKLVFSIALVVASASGSATQSQACVDGSSQCSSAQNDGDALALMQTLLAHKDRKLEGATHHNGTGLSENTKKEWTVKVNGCETFGEDRRWFTKPDPDDNDGIDSVSEETDDEKAPAGCTGKRAVYTVKVDREKVPHFTDTLQEKICGKKEDLEGCHSKLTPEDSKTADNGQDFDAVDVGNGADKKAGFLGKSVFSFQLGQTPRSSDALHRKLKQHLESKQLMLNQDWKIVKESHVLHIGTHYSKDGDKNIFTSNFHVHILFNKDLSDDHIKDIKDVVKEHVESAAAGKGKGKGKAGGGKGKGKGKGAGSL